MDRRLEEARKIINEVDAEMAGLFLRRMEAAKLVAAYKKDHGMPILDAKREEEVILRNGERIEDPVLRGHYTNFLRGTMQVSRAYQRQLMEGMRIAYSGIEGAYAHMAAEKHFPEGEKVSCHSFREAYEKVVSGDCDAALLPIENSSAGEVGQVTDLLFSGPLFINGMVDLHITHALCAVPGAKMADVKRVVSHDQALNQCRGFIRAHGMQEVAFENTALAAKYVADTRDVTTAAICSVESAARYGLQVLQDGISDEAGNTTRFAVLCRGENKALSRQEGAHFVLMFTARNEAGSLARALNIIGAHGFNMRTLRSRPMKELLWQYYFYVEAEGDIHSHEGRQMLEEMSLCCDGIKPAGSFVCGHHGEAGDGK